MSAEEKAAALKLLKLCETIAQDYEWVLDS